MHKEFTCKHIYRKVCKTCKTYSPGSEAFQGVYQAKEG